MMKASDLTRVRDVLVCCSGYVNALTLNTHFHAASGECTSHHFKGLLWVGGSADWLPTCAHDKPAFSPCEVVHNLLDPNPT